MSAVTCRKTESEEKKADEEKKKRKKNPVLPDAVQHFSSLRNPQQLVVCRDIMEVCSLLIGKE